MEGGLVLCALCGLSFATFNLLSSLLMPEVQERLVITMLDRGQTPQQTLRMQQDSQDSMYYAMHCATCAKTLVINVMCHQSSSRKSASVLALPPSHM